ncbi:LuxR C-terminal-related transcriptional regulator [Bradyrhizobium sp. CCBAU 51627]|uniref:LuxR C-terminal-related transcriptional regulator n=1 Tax=Bradyrhizobium sp. CCBAU 51627 TaxID=1325088 RepID=UPI002306B31E|nr:LuxR C-terminal-related transcriptional regulator [Bradyrhizobium sp. CCBAU 51627]
MLATKTRMRPIRLVIADRRPIVLQGFATLFAAEHDFAIVASCLDGAGCLKVVRTLMPDLVLVEDGFSDVTASDMLAVVHAENIPTRLVFYTASLADGDLAAAIAAGACCAISMREEPKTLLQSLRLVASTPDRATAGKEQNGALGDNRLAALTDQERKIMRLVAYGMSNKQIARELKVSPGTIKARLDRISTQLEIKSRTEVAAFALSRLYGGIGALAALIYAALDDFRAANATASGEALTDTLTVVPADGTTEAVTIKINDKKTTSASGKTAKSAFKAGRGETPITETPGQAGKLVQSSTDIAPGTIALQASNAARAALGSYGPFVMTAVGIWICELLNSVAHASSFGDTVFAAAPGSGTGESAALDFNSSADATRGSVDNLAWWHPDTYHQSFAFEAPRSDAISGNVDAVQAIGANAGEDSVSNGGNPHVGSGAIDAPIDHGGFAQAVASDALGKTDHDKAQATAGDESDPGQPQRGLQDAEDGGPGSKQQDEQGAPEANSAHGQSQRDLHHSEDGSATAEQLARDEARSAGGANSGQSERELHGSSGNAPGNSHADSSQHAGAKGQAADESGQAQTAAAPPLGDSFHFKNDIAASDAPYGSDVHDGHSADFIGYGPLTAGHDRSVPFDDFAPIGPSDAEHSALDHARGAQHHLMHDLFV